jgi:hypothetical protein
MGVIELVQLPHNGRKTGSLLVFNDNLEMKLFYRDGRLMHAAGDGLTGMEALIQLVDVAQGEFEFHQGMTTAESTLDMDVPRALMNALKLRDERRSIAHKVWPSESCRKRLLITLNELQARYGFLLHVALRGPSQGGFCAVSSDQVSFVEEANGFTGIFKWLEGYPHPPATKMLIEENERQLALMTPTPSTIMAISVQPGTGLGALNMAAGKVQDAVMAQLSEEGN